MNKVFLTAALVLGVSLVFGVYSAMTQEALDGEKLIKERCGQCHDLVRVDRAKGLKDRAGWERTVDRMIAKQAGLLNVEERLVVLDSLVQK